MSTIRDLQQQIEAARVLREQLSALGDEELIRDSIEGETGLLEMIGSMVRHDGEDAASINGLSAYIADLGKRKDRIKKRVETRRGLVAVALEQAGLKSLETPFGTPALSPIAPSVIVTDESLIPARYFIPQAPCLDKRWLLAVLKETAAARVTASKIDDADLRATVQAGLKNIPGAELSNGGIRLSIRRV